MSAEPHDGQSLGVVEVAAPDLRVRSEAVRMQKHLGLERAVTPVTAAVLLRIVHRRGDDVGERSGQPIVRSDAPSVVGIEDRSCGRTHRGKHPGGIPCQHHLRVPSADPAAKGCGTSDELGSGDEWSAAGAPYWEDLEGEVCGFEQLNGHVLVPCNDVHLDALCEKRLGDRTEEVHVGWVRDVDEHAHVRCCSVVRQGCPAGSNFWRFNNASVPFRGVSER